LVSPLGKPTPSWQQSRAYHAPLGGLSVGKNPLVTRFLHGVLRPPIRPCVPTWDLAVVLEALCRPPFEPIEEIFDQTLSRWIVDAISLAYESSDLPSPLGVKAHSTRGMAASKALLAAVPMQDICNAAGWSTPLTFARFYNLDVRATPDSS
ncbi:hypothetical protein M9458_041656, partial [Cirrhinus mrigala]